MPMLAVIVNGVSPCAASLKGASSGQRELLGEHHELVTADAPERVGLAHHPVEPRGDPAQQLIAGRVPERVVDRGEVIDIDEQRPHGSLAATRAVEHLLAAVEDQRPVGQPSELVVRGHEHELLLAARELLFGPRPLGLELLAHVHQSHIECLARHRQGINQRGRREPQIGDAFAQDLLDSVAPAQAPLGHLVQRRGAMGGQMAEHPPRLVADLAVDLGVAAGHPARDRDCGDRADALEAFANRCIQGGPVLLAARDHALEHVRGARAQSLAEPAQLIARSPR